MSQTWSQANFRAAYLSPAPYVRRQEDDGLPIISVSRDPRQRWILEEAWLELKEVCKGNPDTFFLSPSPLHFAPSLPPPSCLAREGCPALTGDSMAARLPDPPGLHVDIP